MKTLLFYSLAGMLTLTSWSATNPVPMTANQILDEFARTQDRLLSMVYTVTITMEAKPDNLFFVAEVRTDTNRAVSREQYWGHSMPYRTSRVDPDNCVVISDGNTRCRYIAWGKRPGVLNIYPAGVKAGAPDSARRAILNPDNAGYLFGLFRTDGDRCDIELRNASELRVRSQPELVKGIPCRVLEARCTHGDKDEQYTLWFDPAHGYHIARAEYRLGSNLANPSRILRVNQVEFRQVDGVWVPASAEADSLARNLRDGSTVSAKIHVRITDIRLNPKDTPVNAFGLGDVPDGSRVHLTGGPIEGTWQKGRAVDKAGNVYWTPEAAGWMATSKPPESGRTGGADKPMPAGK